MEDGRWSRRGGRGDDRKGRTEDLVRKAKRRFWLHQLCGTTTACSFPNSPYPALVRAEQALPKTTSEQGAGSDPQVRPRFRAVRRCGDTATPRGRSRCKGPHAGADADAVHSSHIPQAAGRVYKKSRGGPITGTSDNPRHFPSIPPVVCANPVGTTVRTTVGALSDLGRALIQELTSWPLDSGGVLTPLELKNNDIYLDV
jgi:hypothetical protein